MDSQWYTKRWVVISLHILFWVLLLLAPLLLRPTFANAPGTVSRHDGQKFLILHTANMFMRMSLFYLNANYFIPEMIYKKKYNRYIAALLLALIIMLGVDRLVFQLVGIEWKYNIWNFFVFNLPYFLFIVITSSAYRLIRDRIESDKRRKERETEHLKTELSFLRSQVSPHFMFNVLNNMVALARKKSDLLEPSLIKLSSLLRYMLYETDEEKVLVEKEVDYLQSYIDLQQQRFGRNVQIQTSLNNIEPGHTIEPMLLIPFVENAFKHGTGLITDARIETSLSIKQGVLSFKVRNRYQDFVIDPKDKTSGIGLNNVKRRLNLLYEHNYKLTIDRQDGWFTVDLQLNLH
jgi:two-component system, LytTR family, sensor kinase